MLLKENLYFNLILIKLVINIHLLLNHYNKFYLMELNFKIHLLEVMINLNIKNHNIYFKF